MQTAAAVAVADVLARAMAAAMRALSMQETFASGQQLACGGSSDGSTRRPWWVPLAHITGGTSGNEVSPASWVVLDDCSTGTCVPTHGQYQI